MNGQAFASVITPTRIAGAVAGFALCALAYLAWSGEDGVVWPLILLIPGVAALLVLSRRDRSTVARLERSIAALEELVLRDPATGLYNRRALFERLKEETARADRHRIAFSIVMLDIDRFKTVNDRYGHAAGDAAIFAIAAHLGDHVRGSDLVARYGGGEFVLLLPQTDRPGATVIAERIRRAVEAAPIPVAGGESIHLTISAGIAAYPEDGPESEALLAAADKALYAAKRAGRNQIGVARDKDPPSA